MSEKRHLAMDYGADSGRAIMGTLRDGKLQMEELHRFPTRSLYIYGSLRWNIYRFYEEMLTAMQSYAQRYGSSLDSIGVDTWGVDYGLLQADGIVQNLPYQYRDDRTQGTAEVIEETLGRRRIYDITGIQFMNINTLNQLIAARRDTPESLESAASMLFIGDVLHYLLTGRQCAEFTVASTSQMLDAYSGSWAGEIYHAFGIPERLQPEIIPAGSVVGTLLPPLAARTGLGSGVRVVAPAVHDTASAAAAIPAQGEDWAYISSGTWCMVGLETAKPVINGASFEMNISNSGGALGTNLFLKNVMGLWMIQQCKRIWDQEGRGLDYPAIVQQALRAKPFAAFLDPDDDLFFAPANGVEAVSEYLRKTGQESVDISDVGTVARLVYEALALKYRYVLDRLCAATGKTVNRLHVIGGGAKNELLSQFTANALGIPVIAGPGEATAMGNLLLQAVGCGEIASLSELRSCVAASADLVTFEPESASAGAWNEAYTRFREVCGLD